MFKASVTEFDLAGSGYGSPSSRTRPTRPNLSPTSTRSSTELSLLPPLASLIEYCPSLVRYFAFFHSRRDSFDPIAPADITALDDETKVLLTEKINAIMKDADDKVWIDEAEGTFRALPAEWTP